MGKAFVCPTLALDKIHLPGKTLEKSLGGSASFASLASSMFSETFLSAIVGSDFPKEYLQLFKNKNIDTSGVQRSKKASFHWHAKYSDDLSTVTTFRNDMNAMDDFSVNRVKKDAKNSYSAFITNIDPTLQLQIIQNLPKETIKILDSMDLWMIEKRDELKKVLKHVDVFLVSEVESVYLVDGNPPVPELIEKIMQLGPKVIVYKRGEYGLSVYGRLGNMVVPSYPFTYAVDPSGAGDALGGVIAGVLAHFEEFNEDTMKTAVIMAGIVASFVVEDYGNAALENLTLSEVLNRAEIYISQLPSKNDVLRFSQDEE